MAILTVLKSDETRVIINGDNKQCMCSKKERKVCHDLYKRINNIHYAAVYVTQTDSLLQKYFTASRVCVLNATG